MKELPARKDEPGDSKEPVAKLAAHIFIALGFSYVRVAFRVPF